MKKSTKGAIAAAAAGVLLLGGAGSLAYWSAEGTVTGSAITSGHLTLDATACGADDGWTLDGETDSFVPATDTLIPGDTLTKNCNVVIDVEGKHFTQVDIEATTPAALTDPWDELMLATTVAGNAAGESDVAVTQGANNVPVVITVTWPYGTEDNDLNGDLSTTLDDIVITAVQNHQAD